MLPQLATFDDPARLQALEASILPTLSPQEAEEWRAAVGGDFTRPVIVGHDLQRIEMAVPSRGTEQRLGHDERGGGR